MIFAGGELQSCFPAEQVVQRALLGSLAVCQCFSRNTRGRGILDPNLRISRCRGGGEIQFVTCKGVTPSCMKISPFTHTSTHIQTHAHTFTLTPHTHTITPNSITPHTHTITSHITPHTHIITSHTHIIAHLTLTPSHLALTSHSHYHTSHHHISHLHHHTSHSHHHTSHSHPHSHQHTSSTCHWPRQNPS